MSAGGTPRGGAGSWTRSLAKVVVHGREVPNDGAGRIGWSRSPLASGTVSPPASSGAATPSPLGGSGPRPPAPKWLSDAESRGCQQRWHPEAAISILRQLAGRQEGRRADASPCRPLVLSRRREQGRARTSVSPFPPRASGEQVRRGRARRVVQPPSDFRTAPTGLRTPGRARHGVATNDPRLRGWPTLETAQASSIAGLRIIWNP